MFNHKVIFRRSYFLTVIVPIVLIFTLVILTITIYQPNKVVIRTPVNIEVELDR